VGTVGDDLVASRAPTLSKVSRTERDLTSPDADDALGEMFASEEFESSLGDALHEAAMELEFDDDLEIVESTTDDEASDDEASDGDDDADPDDAPLFEALPEIILATPDEASDDDAVSRDGVEPDDESGDEPDVHTAFVDDDDEVSDQILEELRRAEIDGPVVPDAEQDVSTGLRRRPRRTADYDPAPVPIPARVPRVLGRKPRVRKVTRVVRHVDPWTVFKVALVAHFVLYITVLTASVLLWNVAYSTNTVDNVERFFESFGWNSFEFNGGELYRAGWIAGLFVVIGLTGLAVLTATLFNLITDLVGGVRFTVLEEEVVETRTSPMRRFVVRRSEPEVPAVLHDRSGAMTREAVVDDTGANDRRAR